MTTNTPAADGATLPRAPKGEYKTPLIYPGGKTTMARHICQLINNTQANAYIETHCGGAAVFFAKARVHPLEILNDIDHKVATFWREVRDNPVGILERCAAAPFELSFYKEQYKIMMAEPGVFPAADVAFAVYYCHHTAYNHAPHPSTLAINSTSHNNAGRGWFERRIPHPLNAAIVRLRETQITQRDAIALMRVCDNEEVLFYVDPPYLNTEQNWYVKRADNHDELLDFLATAAAKFVMSEFHSEELQKFAAARGWHYKLISMPDWMGNGLGRKGTELTRRKQEVLLWNFAPIGGADAAFAPPPPLPLLE